MKRIKYIIGLVLLSTFSCSEKNNYLGDDIRLWKGTEAWEFAQNISKNNFKEAEAIMKKNKYAPTNETPLIRAAFTSLEKTKILVKAGADVNFSANNDFYDTPLLSAERRTNLDVVEYLIFECKADYRNSYVVTIDTRDTLTFMDLIQKRRLKTPKDSIAVMKILEYIDEESRKE